MAEILRLMYRDSLTSAELAQLDWLSDMAYAYECAMWTIDDAALLLALAVQVCAFQRTKYHALPTPTRSDSRR